MSVEQRKKPIIKGEDARRFLENEKSIDLKIDRSKFGTFDLNRPLTDYELKHFDEFMRITDDCNIDMRDVDLSGALKRNIKVIDDIFLIKEK